MKRNVILLTVLMLSLTSCKRGVDIVGTEWERSSKYVSQWYEEYYKDNIVFEDATQGYLADTSMEVIVRTEGNDTMHYFSRREFTYTFDETHGVLTTKNEEEPVSAVFLIEDDELVLSGCDSLSVYKKIK